MAEDAKEQEKQNIISNLFPVGEQSILTAFRNLSPTENPDGAQEAAEEAERQILRETNPHVLTSFEELLEPYDKDDAAQMRWGSLICYRVLREEAKLRGGVLPTFTEQFVKDYDTEQDRKADEETNDKGQQIGVKETARLLRKANV